MWLVGFDLAIVIKNITVIPTVVTAIVVIVLVIISKVIKDLVAIYILLVIATVVILRNVIARVSIELRFPYFI